MNQELKFGDPEMVKEAKRRRRVSVKKEKVREQDDFKPGSIILLCQKCMTLQLSRYIKISDAFQKIYDPCKQRYLDFANHNKKLIVGDITEIKNENDN